MKHPLTTQEFVTLALLNAVALAGLAAFMWAVVT
jgi:hypothetical protein